MALHKILSQLDKYHSHIHFPKLKAQKTPMNECQLEWSGLKILEKEVLSFPLCIISTIIVSSSHQRHILTSLPQININVSPAYDHRGRRRRRHHHHHHPPSHPHTHRHRPRHHRHSHRNGHRRRRHHHHPVENIDSIIDWD